jgi:H+-transporting ATPase
MGTIAPALSAIASPVRSATDAKDGQPSGLTKDEARRRLKKFGPNAMPDTALHPLRMSLEKFWRPSRGCSRLRSCSS